jgi:hypothetical protein
MGGVKGAGGRNENSVKEGNPWEGILQPSKVMCICCEIATTDAV